VTQETHLRLLGCPAMHRPRQDPYGECAVNFYCQHTISTVNRRARSASSVMGSTTDESAVW